MAANGYIDNNARRSLVALTTTTSALVVVTTSTVIPPSCVAARELCIHVHWSFGGCRVLVRMDHAAAAFTMSRLATTDSRETAIAFNGSRGSVVDCYTHLLQSYFAVLVAFVSLVEMWWSVLIQYKNRHGG